MTSTTRSARQTNFMNMHRRDWQLWPLISPPLMQILDVHPIGELFDSDEPATIQQAILTVLSRLDSYKSRIPDFLAEHDWNNEKARLLEAYKRLKA